MEKRIEYYLNLPYTIEMQQHSEEGWFVKVRELPGCMSQGDTAQEALTMIKEAMELWLEVALDDGDPIPEPRPLESYSGKFVVRLPRSLHRDLVESARREGISLNQYINVALATFNAGCARGVPAAKGIATPEELLEKGASPQGRKEIAEETGIRAKLLLEWANHVDLFRIKGVSKEYADLLEASGVDTIPELAQRNPENLCQQLVEVNDKKELVRQLPSDDQVKEWIEQAKELPRVIN